MPFIYKPQSFPDSQQGQTNSTVLITHSMNLKCKQLQKNNPFRGQTQLGQRVSPTANGQAHQHPAPTPPAAPQRAPEGGIATRQGSTAQPAGDREQSCSRRVGSPRAHLAGTPPRSAASSRRSAQLCPAAANEKTAGHERAQRNPSTPQPLNTLTHKASPPPPLRPPPALHPTRARAARKQRRARGARGALTSAIVRRSRP